MLAFMLGMVVLRSRLCRHDMGDFDEFIINIVFERYTRSFPLQILRRLFFVIVCNMLRFVFFPT